MKTIKQILRWAKKQKYIEDLPDVEKVPEQLPETIIPTTDEIVRLISCLPERLRPVVRFIAETGLRWSQGIGQ